MDIPWRELFNQLSFVNNKQGLIALMKCFSKQRMMYAGLITMLRHVNWLALTCCKYRNRNSANITKKFKTSSTLLYPIFLIKICFRWKSCTQGFHWAEGMFNVQNANDTRPEVLLIFKKNISAKTIVLSTTQQVLVSLYSIYKYA